MDRSVWVYAQPVQWEAGKLSESSGGGGVADAYHPQLDLGLLQVRQHRVELLDHLGRVELAQLGKENHKSALFLEPFQRGYPLPILWVDDLELTEHLVRVQRHLRLRPVVPRHPHTPQTRR